MISSTTCFPQSGSCNTEPHDNYGFKSRSEYSALSFARSQLMRILFGGFEKFFILLILLKACVHIFASLHLRQAGSERHAGVWSKGHCGWSAFDGGVCACRREAVYCVGWLDNIGACRRGCSQVALLNIHRFSLQHYIITMLRVGAGMPCVVQTCWMQVGGKSFAWVALSINPSPMLRRGTPSCNTQPVGTDTKSC